MDEQWEHVVVRVGNGQIDTVPSRFAGAVGNSQPGWTGLSAVIEHLGADGWQLVHVEGVDVNALGGRLWFKRRANMARVATPADVSDNVH